MMENLARQWTARLHTIDVEDQDTARVNQFYGALYRCSFLPREMSDVDGNYPKFADGIPLTPDSSLLPPHKFYGDFSMWDTYRAVHPLYNLIAPQQSADMMQSLVTMYEQGGWLPIFPCWNSYTAAMIGDHCSVALADAYVKGIRDFNVGKAYEAMRKNAFETPASYEEYKNGMGRRALASYLKYGYIPLEDSVKEAYHQEEQTSRTLEYAFDDFAVAQLAKALGKEQDFNELMRRSENWRNVINPQTGYCDGRHQTLGGIQIMFIASLGLRRELLVIIPGMCLRMLKDWWRYWEGLRSSRRNSIPCLLKGVIGTATNLVTKLPICTISSGKEKRLSNVWPIFLIQSIMTLPADSLATTMQVRCRLGTFSLR